MNFTNKNFIYINLKNIYFMKEELIKMIKLCGIDLTEIVLDIDIDGYIFNSIELVGDDNIILHAFYDELDFETDWEDIPTKQQRIIINTLKPLMYN